jgi:hypothetical protein
VLESLTYQLNALSMHVSAIQSVLRRGTQQGPALLSRFHVPRSLFCDRPAGCIVLATWLKRAVTVTSTEELLSRGII